MPLCHFPCTDRRATGCQSSGAGANYCPQIRPEMPELCPVCSVHHMAMRLVRGAIATVNTIRNPDAPVGGAQQ